MLLETGAPLARTLARENGGSHSGRDMVAVVGLARGYPQHNAVASPLSLT